MVLTYTDKENVIQIVGFYYMANAAGRPIGTLLSGVLFMLGANASIGMQLDNGVLAYLYLSHC